MSFGLARSARLVALMAAFLLGLPVLSGGAARAADVTPPDTIISDYDLSYDHASFWFRSPDDSTATFRCSLDGAAFSDCTSPAQYTQLALGRHSFEVAAVDAAGNVDQSAANSSWQATAPPPPPVEAPANDPFYGARQLSGIDGAVSGTNVNASADWNEPFTPVRGGVSVWYVWTAPRNGSVTFSAGSSGFQPTVSIFEGDSPDHVSLWSSGIGSATVEARQNATYRIDVDGENGGTGAFDLTWAFSPTGAPANDYFADAQAIDGATGSVTGSTAKATAEPGEPVHSGNACCSDTQHSIWYRWTSPVTGDAFFTTQGSSFDTVMRAYTGSTVNGLVGQGFYWPDANPWTTWSRVVVPVTAGTTYYLALDGADGATGDVQLNWRTAESTGDLIAPTVQMWSPEPGATVTGTIAFLADASDNEAVDRVEYHITPNGRGGDSWYVGEAYGPPYEVDLDTSVLPPGVYDVDATAWDTSGNGGSYGYTITVGGAPAPTLTVPKSFTREAAGPGGGRIKFSATATDYRGTGLTVTCKPASGALFPLGKTTVTCSTADAYGNTVSKSFTITIVDTTAPNLTVPADFAVDATSPAGAATAFTVEATDLVSGNVIPTCTPASGSMFVIGDTTVSCTALDGAGNHASATFSVHVKGADEQIQDARASIASLGLRATTADKLDSQLATAAKQFAAGRLAAGCSGLGEFRDTIARLAGRDLTAAQAGTLDADTRRIGAVVGC